MNIAHQGYIFAIYDKLSNTIGQPILAKAAAPAVRFFSDVANHPDSHVGKHIDDYELHQLGVITHDCKLEPDFQVVLTGTAWKASQQPSGPTLVNTQEAR